MDVTTSPSFTLSTPAPSSTTRAENSCPMTTSRVGSSGGASNSDPYGAEKKWVSRYTWDQLVAAFRAPLPAVARPLQAGPIGPDTWMRVSGHIEQDGAVEFEPVFHVSIPESAVQPASDPDSPP